MVLFFAALIAILGFIFEIRPRINRTAFGVDSWRYLLCAEEIRQNKKIPEIIPDKFILEGPCDYPPLLMLILSCFSKKVTEKYNAYFSPLFDSLHSILVFGISYLLFRNIWVSILAQVLYITTPLVNMETIQLTPRSLAALILTLAMVSIFSFVISASIPFLITGLFFSSLVFLVHKATTQAFFFLLHFIALIENNAWYLFFFWLGLLTAIIISKGYYIKVMRGHLALLKYWWRNRRDRYAHQVRGHIRNINEDSDIVGKINLITNKFPIVTLLAATPYLFIAFFLLFFKQFVFMNQKADMFLIDPVMQKLYYWMIIMLIFSLATSYIDVLKFIGEGTKYALLGTFPAVILLAKYIYVSSNKIINGTIFFVILSCIIQIIILQNKSAIKDEFRIISENLQRIIKFLNQNQDVRLATVPFSLTSLIMTHINGKVLAADSGIRHPDLTNFWPVLRVPISEIFKQYSITFFLLNKNYAPPEELGLKEKDAVLKSGSFLLFRV